MMSSAQLRTTFVALALGAICMVHAWGQDQGVKSMTISRSKFKAAVYAHVVFIPVEPFVVSRALAVQNMKINLAVYSRQAAEAHKQNVDIIVFPEDGIYGPVGERDTIYPYLEQIPDPQDTWVPCDDPDRHKDSDVQVALSCMAKQNQLYLVANMGDKQPCDPRHDPKCPSDKRYQFNTDVAYGPDGQFLAKYHKYNLFFEYQFDRPRPTHVYFDTPFGRVGLMACFDVLFKEPAIPLIEKFNVTVVAFPTGWMDALPLLPAIGFHSSFARAHGVNYLAANLHLPLFKFDGSGLYAPDGAHAFYYGTGISGMLPKLLVAEMDVVKQPRNGEIMSHSAPSLKFETDLGLNLKDRFKKSMKPFSTFKMPHDTDNSSEFESILFEDLYSFKTLDKPSGNLQVCQGKLCCHLGYTFGERYSGQSELFAFGAFDGLHTHDGNYYMQNCVLVKCADAKDKKSCGTAVFNSSTPFAKISMHGQFQTPYVYPQIILSDSHKQLGILGPGAWTFNGTSLETSPSFNHTVLNAILLGRDYSRD